MHNRAFHRLIGLLFVASVVLAGSVSAQSAVALRAHPLEQDLNVDGALDEPAWRTAEIATGFRQLEPHEGAAASHETSVRVLYGSSHLYVGAVMTDDPNGIRRTLGRRDEINQADWFLISIDSYFDQKTAYTFGVNAAGVQFDGLERDQIGQLSWRSGVDASWDAIWASGVRILPDGWSVELRIPYSMLRFAEAGQQTWGIQFVRHISRLGETSEWPLVPRTQRVNLLAHYGRLEELNDVRPLRNIQFTPYTLTQMRVQEHVSEPGSGDFDGTADVGADLKVGVGSAVTLDLTVNPDFGQVEADPAVLNLTAFETFFDEQRPFFVEGTQIYQFSVGPGNLLYTRRVGANAPIVAATKLSGRTGRGLSFGFLGATTGHQLDPTRHYGVARVSQQIGSYSSGGGILTAFNAPEAAGRRTALVGGSDWDLRFANNRYGVEAFVAAAHRRHDTDPENATTGIAANAWLRKRQGAWTGFLGIDVFGDEFLVNDVGELPFTNFVGVLLSVDHELRGGRPVGPFQRATLNSFTIKDYTYDGLVDLGLSSEAMFQGTLRGFQVLELAVDVEDPFGGHDPHETRGLGPWARPFSAEASAEITTDIRRDWQLRPELTFHHQEGGGRAFGAELEAEWNLGSRLSLMGELEGVWQKDILAWASNETFRLDGTTWSIAENDGLPAAPNPSFYRSFEDDGTLQAILDGVEPFQPDHYFVSVFGRRDTRSVDFTLRGTVTFRPNLSLQLYSQLFLARGRFDEFRILVEPDREERFPRFPKRNEFSFSSLQSNLVLRWEYRPGSTIFVVWTHGRRTDDALNPLAPWSASPYHRSVGDQIARTFDQYPDNVFLIKLNYTFLR